MQGQVGSYNARLSLLRTSLHRAVSHALASHGSPEALQHVDRIMQRTAAAWGEVRAAEAKQAAAEAELFRSKPSEKAEEVRARGC